jgi:hypothetical protein
MRPFWDFIQRRMVVSYRRFRTTYLSRLQGTEVWKIEPHFVPKRRYETTNLLCVKSQTDRVFHLHRY